MAYLLDEHVTLLSLLPSPFAMSVKIALAEKGIKYEVFEEEAATFPAVKTDLLLRSNPVHKQVPVLIHRGLPVAESLVILEYIEQTWPASDGCDVRKSFLPQSPYERSVAQFWADFCNKKFWETSLLIMKKLHDEQIQAWNDTAQLYITLDREMSKLPYGKPFFFGEHLTTPDIVLAPLASWITVYESLVNRKFPDAKKCPRLAEWLDAISKHPNVKCSICDPRMLLDNAIRFQQRLRDEAI
ncbi:hypothetical protein O6H91_21G054100 [Diphasiastrum complanatum]|uniref:Uncharacterized protein n=1 Tax=Diphasiastrum complanatum TaxID=34168 RepID=A0ACC2AKL1_DIPCM|nr:hypothetical protein O6H91_21G054100 [Diphasiastrum complanatum]